MTHCFKVVIGILILIQINYFVETLPNVVIVNNKPMTYNEHGDLTELMIGEKNDKKSDLIQDKSKIFKPSEFVTQQNSNSINRNGLITKHNFKWFFPNSATNSNNLPNKVSYHITPSTLTAENNYISITQPPPSTPSNIFLNDDSTSTENTLKTTYDDIYKIADKNTEIIDIQKHPEAHTTQQSHISYHFHSTPAPTTVLPIVPIVVSTPISSDKKVKKKLKKKSPNQDVKFSKHILENLEYYKKVLAINCTNNNNTNADVVVVTPKPKYDNKNSTNVDFIKNKDNDKYINKEEEKHKHEKEDKDKKKCKCKKKHHHHGHHHHHKESHEYKESHEEKPAKPVIYHEKPQETVHKVSEVHTINHIHEHKHKLDPPKVVTSFNTGTSAISIPHQVIPVKDEFFDTSSKLPALGEEYEEVGNMFDTFYKAIENTFTQSKENEHETVDYESKEDSAYDDESEDESEDKANDNDDSKDSEDDNEDEEEEEEEEEEENEDDDYDDDDESEEYKKRRKKRDLFKGSFEIFRVANVNDKNITQKMPNNKQKNLTANIKQFEEDEPSEEYFPYDFLGILYRFLASEKKKPQKKLLPQNYKKIYENYQLWKINSDSQDVAETLKEFQSSKLGGKIFWLTTLSVKKSIDIVVPPKVISKLEAFLKENDIKYQVNIYNIQHAIQQETPKLFAFHDKSQNNHKNASFLAWHRYLTSIEIQSFYDFLKQKYSSVVRLIQIGWSFNGKPLTVVKISYPRKGTRYDMKKPAIFVCAGISSNLWAPTASLNHILDSLVINIFKNDTFGKTIRKFNWYIFSLANPDGYDYSMTFDRLWHKTRSHRLAKNSHQNSIMSAFSWFKFPENSTDKLCMGVDLSKNFDSEWIENNQNDCPEQGYMKTDQEPEAKFLSKFLMKHGENIKLFINLDGYGNKILYPSVKLKQNNVVDLNDMARAGLRNIRMHRLDGKKYEISGKDKQIVFGSPESFAMYKANIKYSYRIELIDNSYQSIFIPASSIEEKAHIILDVIKGMVKHIENE